MKAKHLIIALAMIIPQICIGQNKLFDKYADMDGVTNVYISKSMLSMFPSISGISMSIMNLAGKMESLQLVSSSNREKMTMMRNDFSKIVTRNHEELMRVRDTGKRVTFYAGKKGDLISDLLMVADTDSSFTVIQMLGSFTLKEVRDAAQSMEIK
jgi:hypothetical protein